RRHKVRVWRAGRRADPDRRSADAGQLPLLAQGQLSARRRAAQLRQAAAARLADLQRLEQGAAAARPARRRGRCDRRALPRGVPPSHGPRGASRRPGEQRMTYLARVYVTLRPTVNDPQGLTIRGGLHQLGYAEVESVRAGKYLELRLDAP